MTDVLFGGMTLHCLFKRICSVLSSVAFLLKDHQDAMLPREFMGEEQLLIAHAPYLRQVVLFGSGHLIIVMMFYHPRLGEGSSGG